ncbi:hypothetical protein ACRALDRAFT_211335 [Sodiomyces alcalophilus JCM 7366]|uniref:uncharacterized protein n=1 Tax=Sodiomyces alcalophilus JCM 7366 TaxID=591952 RepID=UPI0039B446E0
MCFPDRKLHPKVEPTKDNHESPENLHGFCPVCVFLDWYTVLPPGFSVRSVPDPASATPRRHPTISSRYRSIHSQLCMEKLEPLFLTDKAWPSAFEPSEERHRPREGASRGEKGMGSAYQWLAPQEFTTAYADQQGTNVGRVESMVAGWINKPLVVGSQRTEDCQHFNLGPLDVGIDWQATYRGVCGVVVELEPDFGSADIGFYFTRTLEYCPRVRKFQHQFCDTAYL